MFYKKLFMAAVFFGSFVSCCSEEVAGMDVESPHLMMSVSGKSKQRNFTIPHVVDVYKDESCVIFQIQQSTGTHVGRSSGACISFCIEYIITGSATFKPVVGTSGDTMLIGLGAKDFTVAAGPMAEVTEDAIRKKAERFSYIMEWGYRISLPSDCAKMAKETLGHGHDFFWIKHETKEIFFFEADTNGDIVAQQVIGTLLD
jgi:hypothetical protein